MAAHRKLVHLRVSLRLKALARGIAKSVKVPVFRLLGFSMLVSVPLPQHSTGRLRRRDGQSSDALVP